MSRRAANEQITPVVDPIDDVEAGGGDNALFLNMCSGFGTGSDQRLSVAECLRREREANEEWAPASGHSGAPPPAQAPEPVEAPTAPVKPARGKGGGPGHRGRGRLRRRARILTGRSAQLNTKMRPDLRDDVYRLVSKRGTTLAALAEEVWTAATAEIRERADNG